MATTSQGRGACPGSAWGLNGKVGHGHVFFSSRRRPLRSSPLDGRGAHPRIRRESCRSPLKFAQRGKPRRKGKMVYGHPHHKRGQERTNWTACEALGRQERTTWTAWEAPGRQERTNWTACKVPGRQERTNWTAWEAPGRHQGSRKGPIGGTREARKDQLDSLGGTRETPGTGKD